MATRAEFGRSDRPGLAGFGALVAAGAHAPRGRAQRGPRRARRRRLRPAGLLRLRHRHPDHRRPGRRRRPPGQLPHHGPVLAHPGLPADRAQPPPQRHGPGGRPGHRAIPGYWGKPPKENGFLSEILRDQRLRHLRRGEVAPHPRGRDPHGGVPGHLAAGPGLRPLVRLPRRARPTSSSPPSTTTTTRSGRPHRRGRLPPERRPGRPGHRVRGRPAGRRRRPAVLPLLRHRGLPLAPPGPARVDRPLPGPLRRRVGRLAGARPTPASSSWGSSPRAPRSRPRPPWVPAWDDLDERRRRRWPPASWSASPASSPTPTTRSAGCSASWTTSATSTNTVVMVVSDNGASAEGGPEGSINDIRLTNLDPAGHRRDATSPHRRDRRAAHPQQLPVGLDHGRQHARSSAGSARSTRAGWPTRASSAGRPAWRPAPAASATSSPTPSTCCPPCSSWSGIEPPRPIDRRAPDAPRRHQLRLPAGPTAGRRPPSATTPSTSRCSARRALYHRGWKAVTYHPVGPLYDDGLRPRTRRSTTTSGSSTTWPRTCPRPQDLAAEQPERVAEMVELWWEEAERNQVLPARQPGAVGAHPSRSPTTGRPARPLPLLPGRGPGARGGGRQRAEPVPRHHRRVEVPEGGRARRGPAGPGLGARRLVAPPARRPAALRPQPLRQDAPRDRSRRACSAPGRHTRCASPSRRTSGLGGTGTLCVDGAVVAEGPIARFTPSGFNGVGVGLTCGYEWGPAVGDGYLAPFPFNGTIIRAVVEATGPVVRDPLAEIAAIMSEQ